MIDDIYIFSNLLFLIVVSFTYVLLSTSIHECIHAKLIFKYSPTSKVIVFAQYNFMKKNPKVCFFKEKFGKGGLTVPDNNFIPFSENIIKKMAIIPNIVDTISYGFATILLTVVSFISRHKMINEYNSISTFATVFVNVVFWFVFLLFIVPKFTPDKITTWRDIEVYNNPNGFIRYMKKQNEKCGKDSYQYLLLMKKRKERNENNAK